jgi:hypothetical protein
LGGDERYHHVVRSILTVDKYSTEFVDFNDILLLTVDKHSPVIFNNVFFNGFFSKFKVNKYSMSTNTGLNCDVNNAVLQCDTLEYLLDTTHYAKNTLLTEGSLP